MFIDLENLNRSSCCINTLLVKNKVDDCKPKDTGGADFVYFGCGLHLLQLIPDRTMKASGIDA